MRGHKRQWSEDSFAIGKNAILPLKITVLMFSGIIQKTKFLQFSHDY
ncbi:MAG: hypothetical protein ACOC34_00105 [Thermotogota bacterium]